MADMDKINEMIGNKQFQEAKELIEAALKENSNNKELLKLAGLTYVNLEFWGDAKRFFETVVKFDPEDATSWFYLANSYEKLGEFISAKNSYIKVIELRPAYMEAYKNLCVVFFKLKDSQGAIKFAEEAINFDNEDFLYEFIIGTAYMKEKEFSKALPYLLKSLEKSPENTGTLNSLGTCYMALGKTDIAIENYKKVIELYPENSMAYFNIGSAYQILQEHSVAVTYLKKAVELEEDDESFINALAMSEVKLNDYESALEHYKQLAILCPSKENYKYNVVTCYEALGQYDVAINMLEGIVYVNPKYTLPAQKLASLYIKTNKLNKAKEIYDNILLKNNVTADVLHQYAILSSTLCDTDTAEKILKKVIRMNPELAKAHKDLGIIYLNKRLFDYAEAEFEIALKISPKDFDILFEYGNFLYSVSKNLEADKYYSEALEIEPKNVPALTFMALNKLVLTQLDEAENYIMRAVEIEPNHEYVQFCAGRILYAKQDYDKAKMYLVRAVEQNPDIETQNTLALTYFELKEYQQALNIFKNIDEKRPKSVPVLMNIAKCYENLGQNDDALQYLYKVTEVFPDSEDAHDLIRKLS